jgi:glycosyltransferase involved in cell wall biosynthesis
VKLATGRGLNNIQFFAQQPRERIPIYISAADVCLVMLRKSELFKTVIPTKLLEYMACERPVIVAVDGHSRQIIEESGAGIFIEPGDSRALANAILESEREPALRRTMGASGRRYIINKFSREETAREYITVLEGLGT